MAKITKERVEKVLNDLIDLHDDMAKEVDPLKCYGYEHFMCGVKKVIENGPYVAETILNPKSAAAKAVEAIPETVRVVLKKASGDRSATSLKLEKARREIFG